jgi:multicomponent Na+:H+ antiporter subunit G
LEDKQGGITIFKLLGYAFVINGTFFFIVTAIAMLRFKDFYTRLHIGSKCLTGGGISILLGIIFFKGLSLYSLKLGLIIIFLVITNPVTTHALARASYYSKKLSIPENSNLIRDDLHKKKNGGLL